jgi:thiamine pyrophosphate-dependent acetolactate synthase large subunit-like protein
MTQAGMPSAVMASMPHRRRGALAVLTFGNPDFVRYAGAYGAKGWRVATRDALIPTRESSCEEGGLHLVTERKSTN